MLCLGVDTTGPACRVSLVDEARVLAHHCEEIGRGHAEFLAPQTARLFKEAQIHPKQIDRLAVTTGPGSFTGLRVGLSFVKGFALPRHTPIIGISVLECLAKQADPEARRTIAGVLDVRRGQVFWQIFVNGVATSAPKLNTVEAAKAKLKTLDAWVGNGVKLLGQSPEVETVCTRVLAWASLDMDAKHYPPNPLYHRDADAKLPGGKLLVA